MSLLKTARSFLSYFITLVLFLFIQLGCSSSSNQFTVGGTLFGLADGTSVVLQNNGEDNLTLLTNGPFTFPTALASGSGYTVTLLTQPEGQACSVIHGSNSNISSNVTNIEIVCSTDQFAVGGTLSGLADGASIVLQNNGGDNLPLSANGPFTFQTALASGSDYTVTVLTQPSEQTCTVTNGSGTVENTSITNISVACTFNDTTLSVSTTGIIPVNGGSGSLTVTNTGTIRAQNVSATLPVSWTNVIQDSTACATIPPNGGTCQLSFTSTSAYVAQSGISISGDNIPSPPTSSFAFSIDGYLVFTTPSASTALVVASSDVNSSIAWSPTDDAIAGIYQTSLSPPCNGNIEGDCTSDVIVTFYNVVPLSNYAAGLCYEITADNSGAVPQGTWYLPAICQINSTLGNIYGSGCVDGAPSIYTNLYNLGFDIGLFDNYWASTECAYVNTAVTDQCNGATNIYAWGANFGGLNDLFTAPKSFALGARCVRSVSY